VQEMVGLMVGLENVMVRPLEVTVRLIEVMLRPIEVIEGKPSLMESMEVMKALKKAMGVPVEVMAVCFQCDVLRRSRGGCRGRR